MPSGSSPSNAATTSAPPSPAPTCRTTPSRATTYFPHPIAERALALHDDDVGVLALERGHHLRLHLARAELRDERVESHSVLPALDDGGLAGAHHHCLDTAGVEGPDEQRCGGALADRAVGAEHGDPRAGHVEDAAREQLQVLLLLGLADVRHGHAGQEARGDELGVVVQELVPAVEEARKSTRLNSSHYCATRMPSSA